MTTDYHARIDELEYLASYPSAKQAIESLTVHFETKTHERVSNSDKRVFLVGALAHENIMTQIHPGDIAFRITLSAGVSRIGQQWGTFRGVLLVLAAPDWGVSLEHRGRAVRLVAEMQPHHDPLIKSMVNG